MIHFFARLTLLLAPILLIAAALPEARPGVKNDFQALLAASADCVSPCWAGIRPGMTEVGTAIDRLNRNPWVKTVRPVGGMLTDQQYGGVTWEWSGLQPFPADVGSGGTLTVSDKLVVSILIPTTIRFGEAWLALGRPSYGSMTRASYPYAGFNVSTATYPQRGLTLRTIVTRPAHLDRYWNAPVTIIIAPTSPDTGPFFRLPCWAACPPGSP